MGATGFGRNGKWRASVAFLVVVALVAVAGVQRTSHAATCATDPYVSAERSRLSVFTNWLSSNGVLGYLGEVGWPNEPDSEVTEWNCLGDYIYQDADAAGLWVTYWSTGEFNPGELSAYTPVVERTPVLRAAPQAPTIEAHPTAPMYRRGINFADGKVGSCYNPNEPTCSKFSNMRPGVLGVNYGYGSAASYAFLSTRGIKLIRLPFRWERVQPTLCMALDNVALGALKASLATIGQLGLKAILSAHNGGGYYIGTGLTPSDPGISHSIGSSEVPLSAFVNFWKRMSTQFKSNSAVLAYDLMNEPALLSPAQWEQYSQAALTAIRNNGDNKLIMVAGSAYSAAGNWTSNDPSPWISDPSSNFRYEAHQYFDDGSAQYLLSYAGECALRNGGAPCP